jgi:MOSC domain-containing protein YiiM
VDLSFRFDWWYARLPASPRDEGVVARCVVRPSEGERSTPAKITLTPERGIDGDRWIDDPHRRPGNQVSLMNVHVLRSVAGDEERMSLAGDNLIVDLDISEVNLPPGTRLSIGDAELEISNDPHRPCRQFHSRFGATNVKKVVRANRVGKRARGVLARIVKAGTIRVGDRIRVQRSDSTPVQHGETTPVQRSETTPVQRSETTPRH